MIDKAAFHSLSYGLYLVSARFDGAPVGCVVNTFAQVASDPAQASVAINKGNHTIEGVRQSGAFEAVALSSSATMELIGTFGLHSSVDTDKFSQWSHRDSEQGLPFVDEQACAHFSVKVTQEVDLGSHVLFVGEIVAAESLSREDPMTYAYYHEVKGGTTPPRAPGYYSEGGVAFSGNAPKVAWRCTVCGHIEYVDELPEDFVCPVCGASRDKFERIEV